MDEDAVRKKACWRVLRTNQQYDPYVCRIIIGDCEKEGIIWGLRIVKPGWTPDKICSLLSSYFPAEVVEQFGRDIYEIARSFGGEKAFCYHMRYGNSFPGLFQSMAYHAVDLSFLFQTYNHLLPDKLAKAVEQMGRHWITFINGGDPCSPTMRERESAMCYGSETMAALNRKEDEMGRYECWEKLGGNDDWSRCSMAIRGEVDPPAGNENGKNID
ncbi:hypothetical protein CLAIMM_13293 [Cladophialophora immunda]|nr:hypothetical protein CLAIMM_13293 [Cladophialophora immunda]